MGKADAVKGMLWMKMTEGKSPCLCGLLGPTYSHSRSCLLQTVLGASVAAAATAPGALVCLVEGRACIPTKESSLFIFYPSSAVCWSMMFSVCLERG